MLSFPVQIEIHGLFLFLYHSILKETVLKKKKKKYRTRVSEKTPKKPKKKTKPKKKKKKNRIYLLKKKIQDYHNLLPPLPHPPTPRHKDQMVAALGSKVYIHTLLSFYQWLLRLYLKWRGWLEKIGLWESCIRNLIQLCCRDSLIIHCWQIECENAFLCITKTRLYNFDPLQPHFYIVKLGFTGVHIIFLISAQKHRLWVLVRTASVRRF